MNSLRRIASSSLKSPSILRNSIRSMTGERGSGAGKGGGSGGTIRESGGAFGKREAAQEELYFRKKADEQLKNIKEHLHDEIETHQKLIREHEEAIEKTKSKIKELQKGVEK